MAKVIELKPGEEPPEAPYILVQVHPTRRESMLATYGTVRFTSEDSDEIEREIRHAQFEADQSGRAAVYVRRQT